VPEPGRVTIRGPGLDAADLLRIALEGARVEIAPDAIAAMERSRARVEELAGTKTPVYGISTGFGALAATQIAPERRSELQHSLLRSHAAGVGPPLATPTVRAIMALRLRSLAMGFSGVRPAVAEALAALLNAGVTPVVPTHGSLGASGDLAPLAHVGLCLLGEGEAFDQSGRLRAAAEVLTAARLRPIELEVKEGLALINGTDGMLAMLLIAAARASLLFATADVTAAMSVEALFGTDRPFAADLSALRPQPGQARSAANLTRLLEGSNIVASHRHSTHVVQDSYSMRCAPQVAGAARDTLDHARAVAARELESAIDNPVVLPDGRVESNGNFHGEPLAFAADFLAIAAAEVGAIAERRVDQMLDPHRSRGLPAFLAPEPGVNSGLMLAQYTAAALVAENRRLAAPASVDSIPTSGMQEDHVSMGWGACLKLERLLGNLGYILAIELACAAQALDLRAPLQPARGTAAVRDLVRSRIPPSAADRPVAPDLEIAAELVNTGRVRRAAEEAVGPLA
jgi:histidine ammonia-lyase